jgi:hypothetical protein
MVAIFMVFIRMFGVISVLAGFRDKNKPVENVMLTEFSDQAVLESDMRLSRVR